MDRDLTLRITLEKPTAGVDFGLQKGRGNNYETVQTQRSKGKDLLFECSVRVNKAKDSKPNFLGDFVQGPVGERFVYIDIGTYAGQEISRAIELKYDIAQRASAIFWTTPEQEVAAKATAPAAWRHS